jgi:hypothetical protein
MQLVTTTEHPENSPTYFIEPESDVGKVLRTEFDTIWGEEDARQRQATTS